MGVSQFVKKTVRMQTWGGMIQLIFLICHHKSETSLQPSLASYLSKRYCLSCLHFDFEIAVLAINS